MRCTRYRFGLDTAEFLVCRRCGVYIGAYGAGPPGNGFATLNLNALRTPVEGIPATTPTDYDSEDREGRIRRREQRWTPGDEAALNAAPLGFRRTDLPFRRPSRPGAASEAASCEAASCMELATIHANVG